MKRMRGFGGRSYGRKKSPMEQMLKLQEELQKKMEEMESRLAQETVEVSAGGGAVRLKMGCDYRVHEVSIDEDLASDVEMLQDLMVAAFNEAVEEVEERRKEISREMFGDLGMPGLTF